MNFSTKHDKLNAKTSRKQRASFKVINEGDAETPVLEKVYSFQTSKNECTKINSCRHLRESCLSENSCVWGQSDQLTVNL